MSRTTNPYAAKSHKNKSGTFRPDIWQALDSKRGKRKKTKKYVHPDMWVAMDG
jgi:hypothetical protein